MSFSKKWVSNKLGRNRTPSGADLVGSSSYAGYPGGGGVPPSPCRNGGEPVLSNGGGGGGGGGGGRDISSPLANVVGPSVVSAGTPPKKAWEWHYKSFLSRRGGGGAGGGGGKANRGGTLTASPPGLNQSRSLSSSDIRTSFGGARAAASPRASASGRRKSPSPPSPLGDCPPPQTPPKSPRSKFGAGSAAAAAAAAAAGVPSHPSSAPVNRSQSDPTSSSGRQASREADLIAGIPPPPVLASSFSASQFPAPAAAAAAAVAAPSNPNSTSTSSPPPSPTAMKLPLPLAFRRQRSPAHLAPRPQPIELSASTSDTAIRGGSLFKSVFKHGGGSGGNSNSNSNNKADELGAGPSFAASRAKAKSYDSLDATVRKGNEVAYGRAAGGGSHGHQSGSLQQRPAGTSRSWDSKLYATGPSASTPSLATVVGEPPRSAAAAAAAAPVRVRSGADIGPSGTATPIVGPPSSSTSSDQMRRSREIKKAFTEFHNSNQYGADTTSPYLGDDPSVRQNNYFSVRYGNGAVASGGVGGGAPDLSSPLVTSQLSTSPHTLFRVTEGEASMAAACVLKPMAGAETWLKDRRYLIGPAVLCMCPLQVLSSLPIGGTTGASLSQSHGGGTIGTDGSTYICDTEKDNPALSDERDATIPVAPSDHCNVSPMAYGRVRMGKASVAREIAPEGYGAWSNVVLVLRQNYLFEYEQGAGLNERPRGFALVQNAVSYPDGNSPTELRLEFYESPCAGGDMRKVLIRVETQEERDGWIVSLMEAARLAIEDLYEYDATDDGLEFGRGRYATIRPARRRVGSLRSSQSLGGLSNSLEENNLPRVGMAGSLKHAKSVTINKLADAVSCSDFNCALKIINKNEFWSRVIKGRERADTLVRETAVQASLTAQVGHLPTFLRLRNFFETIDHIVLELELLQGTDLFHHVSSKGVLDENEAAHIMRDLLTCIDAMKRIGIAHRDVKPANVLMCRAEDGDGVAVKLGDFGMATFVGPDNLVRGRCGTPGYVAPEILRSAVSNGYGNSVDVFSLGVTLYVLLCGYEPFYGECDAELIACNRQAAVEFPDSDWGTVSIEGRDLVERMLEHDPNKRIGASEALQHPWITRRAPSQIWAGRENNCGPGEAACVMS